MNSNVCTFLDDFLSGCRGYRRFLIAIATSLVVYPLIALWTVLCIALLPGLFVLWKAVKRWSAERIMRHFIWLYGRGWMVIIFPFVRFQREGLENLRLSRPSILIVNHYSFFDTYCMALLPFHNISFAVRAWPFRMFWYGCFMRLAGYIDVETTCWDDIRLTAGKVLREGGHMLFFPEGHRSRDGRLQRFYRGAFRLAEETGAPLVPLCLTGTGKLLPPGRLLLEPAKVTLRALPKIDPADFPGPDGHREMLREASRRMAENIEAMEAK